MMRARAVRWGLSVVVPWACPAAPAFAATCDPSGWFCEPDAVAPLPPEKAPPVEKEPGAPKADEPAAAQSEPGTAARAVGDLDEPASPPDGAAPPEGAPAQPAEAEPAAGDGLGDDLPPVAVDDGGYSSAHLVEPQPRAKRKLRQELRKAIIARAESALINDNSGNDPRIAGLGVGLRLRPTRHFGFEGAVDFLAGRDWNGFSRKETVGSVSAIAYLNSRAKVLVYLPVGLNLARAHVTVESDYGDYDANYTYFGGHAGLGAEIPLTPGFSVNGELLGFVRSRTDADRGDPPEFVDGNTGKTTNSSGGLLLRLGASFYF